MRKESLANKEKVYRAMLTEYKTILQLRDELDLTGKALQTHIRFLIEHKLIQKRREEVDRPGVAFSYRATDSSDVYTFAQKVEHSQKGTPKTIGRCDFAASWVPKQTEGARL
jgi:predicted transcriptional regulator